LERNMRKVLITLFEDRLRAGDIRLDKGQLIKIRFSDHCDGAPALGETLLACTVSLYHDNTVFNDSAAFDSVTAVSLSCLQLHHFDSSQPAWWCLGFLSDTTQNIRWIRTRAAEHFLSTSHRYYRTIGTQQYIIEFIPRLHKYLNVSLKESNTLVGVITVQGRKGQETNLAAINVAHNVEFHSKQVIWTTSFNMHLFFSRPAKAFKSR
jgi:hypothetical protein